MTEADDGAGRRRRALALLWGETERPSRGPKPSLSRERVVAAAVAIADAEGLAAVSMQRLATELGVTKMAMYRYVPGKSELTLLMVDDAMGQAPEPAAGPGDWAATLENWARQLWDRLVAHPWVLGATVGLRPIGPA
ncbi:MAG: TetR/AcrR family transcriptional regulator, partial [Stackebrandtia sp.]